VSELCPFQPLLKLKSCLPAIFVDVLGFLMDRVGADLTAFHNRIRAADNGADLLICMQVFRAKAMTIACERDVTIVDSAAWMSKSNAINHNDPYLRFHEGSDLIT
jgi:hypothetical protein